MNSKRITWGVFLVLIGIMFALRNFGFIHFNWGMVLSLWPLIIVIWGISLLPVKEWIKLVISLTITILAFIIVIQTGGTNYSCGCCRNKATNKECQVQKLNLPYDSSLSHAKLDFDAAAGEFTFDSISANLVDFDRSGDFASFSLTSLDEDSTRIVNLKMKDSEFSVGTNKNKAHIRLNPNPLWDIEMNAGAAEINADFSSLKIRNIDFEAGASKLTLRIGKLQALTNISLNSGVTSVTVEIPKESGCKLTNQGALTHKNIDGFVKTDDNEFCTPNFRQSPNKIIIVSESAISDLKIVRY